MGKMLGIYLLVLLSLPSILCSQTIKIDGAVTDENNKPLPYVNVYLLNSTDGEMTNENGMFNFSTKLSKKVTLVASMVGYKISETELDLSNKEYIENINIKLIEEAVELSEAIVMGSAFSSEEGKGIVLKSMDVMTTPGGAADIFQSLKTMPGLTQVSESAELYVRGGDPSETVTIIDQASMYHPFTYESSFGGLFSNLNTSSVKGMYFSSGGFSSKYGNVLSGVLDIETKDEPLAENYSLGISMAAISLGGEIPIVGDKFGIRIYGQQSFTKPIMWLNGELDEFTVTPTSRNLSTSISYRYSNTGKLKLFGLFADDKQGVNVDRAEYSGGFSGNSNNNLLNFQITEILFSEIILKSSLSYNKHNNIWSLGILDLSKADEVYKSRTDLEYNYSSNTNILTGFEIELRKQSYIGTIPDDDFDIRPEGNGRVINESIVGTRIGAYAEFEFSNLFNVTNMYAVTGGRVDFIPELNYSWLDPRLGLGYKLDDKSTIKFAWGIFHQLPDNRLFAEVDGNPELEAMKATHYVLSYDYVIDKKNTFRIEAYHKNYENLPLENDILNYDNNGYGFASGVDAIIKGALPFDVNGWLSYGFINTKRKWMDYEKLTNSDFNINHNFTMVAKYNFSSMWQIGINYKYATGRPFTPIIGSEYREVRKIYEPIYGLDNSDRYKDYQRLDFRITHLNQLFNKYFIVFYLEALNVLNFNNSFGYAYNSDYSEKKVVKSYFGRRTIVVGAQINL